MWYEILPSVGIIMVVMSVPNFLSKYLNLAVDGKTGAKCLLVLQLRQTFAFAGQTK